MVPNIELSCAPESARTRSCWLAEVGTLRAKRRASASTICWSDTLRASRSYYQIPGISFFVFP